MAEHELTRCTGDVLSNRYSAILGREDREETGFALVADIFQSTQLYLIYNALDDEVYGRDLFDHKKLRTVWKVDGSLQEVLTLMQGEEDRETHSAAIKITAESYDVPEIGIVGATGELSKGGKPIPLFPVSRSNVPQE